MQEIIIGILKEVKPNIEFDTITDFIDAGIFDSLDIVKIIRLIEKNYNIIVPPKEVDIGNFISIESMVNMIDRIKQ